jgi:hypothetical protein
MGENVPNDGSFRSLELDAYLDHFHSKIIGFLSKVLLVPLDLPQKVVPAHFSRNSSVSNLGNYAL